MMSIKGSIAAAVIGLVAGVGCSSTPPKTDAGVVETTTTTVATPAGMTFAECQASAEYPGGRYAVEYDNGVCTVQKPAAVETTTTTVEDLAFSSCAEAKAKGYESMRKGDPGYSSKLDRDGDGVACDS